MRRIAEKLLQLVASFHRIKVVAVNIRALVSALVDVVKACVHKASLNGLHAGSAKRLIEYEYLRLVLMQKKCAADVLAF